MLTIALADDHAVVRQGLRLLLESDPEFVVVGEAANGIEALKLVQREKPDVLIADLMMPGLDGLETTRRLSRLKLNTRVVILTMLGDEAYLLDALRSGASGYIVKESCGNDLFQAIRDVRAGRRYLSVPLPESFTRTQLQKFQTALLKLSDRLNPRQRKMLQLVFEGASNRDIGARLRISLRTVESDLAKLLGLLGLNTRQDTTRQPVNRQRRSKKRTKLIEGQS
jgi:two-component system, NarL family, response regulator NreC